MKKKFFLKKKVKEKKMASKSVIYMNLIILILVSNYQIANGIHHCELHRYANSINSTDMQFTKEAVNIDYALIGEFKSLHCCAKGYRSIEW